MGLHLQNTFGQKFDLSGNAAFEYGRPVGKQLPRQTSESCSFAAFSLLSLILAIVAQENVVAQLELVVQGQRQVDEITAV